MGEALWFCVTSSLDGTASFYSSLGSASLYFQVSSKYKLRCHSRLLVFTQEALSHASEHNVLKAITLLRRRPYKYYQKLSNKSQASNTESSWAGNGLLSHKPALKSKN